MGAAVHRVIGVYDADGSLRGELAYWLKARFGKAHCALCDVTHGLTRMKPEWRECRTTLPVEFATYHRDDQPEHVRAATGNAAPVVVADTDRGVVLLLGPQHLERCDGDPEALVDAVRSAIADRGLEWAALT
jgi:hypothetical protein